MHELNHGNVFHFLYVCSDGMPIEMSMLSLLFKGICCVPGDMGSLGGYKSLLEAAKSPTVDMNWSQVVAWLANRGIWTLCKPPGKLFKRSKVVVADVDADLVDVQ